MLNKEKIAQNMLEVMRSFDRNATKIMAEEALNECLTSIMKALAKKQEVNLPEIGKLTAVYSEPRTARHPQTGAYEQVSGRWKIKLKTGRRFKDLMGSK